MAQPRVPSVEAVTQPVRLGHPPTYADVEALAPQLRGEIVNGQLYVLPKPRPRHALVQGRLLTLLDGPFGLGRGGPGGWWILPEIELHLSHHARPIDPDLSGFRRERMPAIPDAAALSLAPDWVCEVLSASTEIYDRSVKMPVYARHGVPWAWLIDPEERALEAYRQDDGVWRPLGTWRGGERARVAPFEAVELELGLLWG